MHPNWLEGLLKEEAVQGIAIGQNDTETTPKLYSEILNTTKGMEDAYSMLY